MDQSDQLLVLNEGETQEPFYGNLGSLEPSQAIHDQIPDINTQSDPMVSASFSFNVYNTFNHNIQIFQTKTQDSVYENLAPAQKSCEVSDQILDFICIIVISANNVASATYPLSIHIGGLGRI